MSEPPILQPFRTTSLDLSRAVATVTSSVAATTRTDYLLPTLWLPATGGCYVSDKDGQAVWSQFRSIIAAQRPPIAIVSLEAIGALLPEDDVREGLVRSGAMRVTELPGHGDYALIYGESADGDLGLCVLDILGEVPERRCVPRDLGDALSPQDMPCFSLYRPQSKGRRHDA